MDIQVDSKKSAGWLLKGGRKNGICINEIMNSDMLFNQNTGQEKPVFSGQITATFWRVMKIRSSDPLDSDDEQDEFIPDEGLPALAILSLAYRDENWLETNGLTQKKRISKLLDSELSTTLSSTLSSPVVPKSRMIDFRDERPKSKLIQIIKTQSFEYDKTMELDLPNLESKSHDAIPNAAEPSFQQETPKENIETNISSPDDDFTIKRMKEDTADVNSKVKVDKRKIPKNLVYKKTQSAYRRRIPMTVKSSDKTLVYRITLDKFATVSHMKNLIDRQLVRSGYKEAKSINWANDSGVKKSWDAIINPDVSTIENIYVVVPPAA